MNMRPSTSLRRLWLVAILLAAVCQPPSALAVTNVFFSSNQTTNLVEAGTTSDTIGSEGYLFTFTRDKLFTGGIGLTNPIGRYLRVQWPDGLEAQAVTAGPVLSKARITLKRQDNQPFAIRAFTFRLLANTAGAGGSIEIMPLLNGEDGLPEPAMFNATGIAGNQFTYNPTNLAGFDTYKISLYVDYALMSLTVVDPSIPPPSLMMTQLDSTWVELAWPTNAVGYVLESAANLPSGPWSRVDIEPIASGDLFFLSVEMINPRHFFRLRK